MVTSIMVTEHRSVVDLVDQGMQSHLRVVEGRIRLSAKTMNPWPSQRLAPPTPLVRF